jgi:hypothetical protein
MQAQLFSGFSVFADVIAIHPIQVFRACIVQQSSLQGSESLSRNCPFRYVSLM